MRTEIITVWKDDCDDEGTPYIVATDVVEGGESDTIRCFSNKAKAVAFAKKLAKKKGLQLRIEGL